MGIDQSCEISYSEGEMLKLWTDGLFLFAVAAGIVYEFLYEPVCIVVSYCLRTTGALITGAWHKIAGERAETASQSRHILRPPGP